jgi:hypothetical protein
MLEIIFITGNITVIIYSVWRRYFLSHAYEKYVKLYDWKY